MPPFTPVAHSGHPEGELKVTEAQRQDAITLCVQSDEVAAIGSMQAFATTDFRADLNNITVPTLVLHGDSDGTVPIEGSGKRIHAAIAGSALVVLKDAPHGCNASNAHAFSTALLDFLRR